MERVENIGSSTFVLRTRQLAPNHWSCDVFARDGREKAERFLLEHFGESELEAIAMALSEAGN